MTVRKVTTELLRLAEEMEDYKWLAEGLIHCLSEDEVADIADHYGWIGESDDL